MEEEKQNDTDGDGLTDWEEADTDNELIKWVEGNYELPTYYECIMKTGGHPESVMNMLREKVPPAEYEAIKNRVVLPLDSDPTMEDTDGDGINDNEDFAPLNSMSEDDKIIYDFFENAEDFEIRFIFENPWMQQIGTKTAIKCVEIFRNNKKNRNPKQMKQDMISAGILEDDSQKSFKDKVLIWLGGNYMNPAAMLFAEYELYENNMSFSQLLDASWAVWSNDMKIIAQIWIFGVSDLMQQGWAEWDYSYEYKLSLEQEKSLKTFVEAKRIGSLRGDTKRLNANERKVVGELLEEGRSIEVLPEGTESSPDFIVDGLKTELKTLENHNLNTPLKKIRKAFDKQGAEAMIYDVRPGKLTEADVEIVYERITGIYDGNVPGIIEFWTLDGKVIFNP